MERVIGHLDLDYFYAQVEEVEKPSLKTLPVLVCVYSGRTQDSGVVSTANYRARALGIKSGMPITLAKRKLEQEEAVFIQVDHSKYEQYSERIMRTARQYVDVMEQTGIDEAFFDITRRSELSYDSARGIAAGIKRAIYEEESITCSIGIAPNKSIAKICSDFRKPDGLTVVRPDEVANFIGPMNVERLYGVGPKSAKILNEAGVTTLSDLTHRPIEDIERILDRKLAIYLWNAANGVDEEPVTERAASTQISRIITLKRDSREPSEILAQLGPAIEDVQRRVREKGLFFRSISVIGILDDLSTKNRSKTLESPTDEPLVLSKGVSELLTALTSEGRNLRRAGVRVSDFTESQKQQSLADFLG